MKREPHATSDTEAIAQRIAAAAATVAAPEELRRQIDAQRRPAAHGRRIGVRRAPQATAAALATALVLAAAVAVSLPDAGPGSPSLADAAALALRSPTAPVPSGGERGPTVDGVTFPDLAYSAPQLRALGVRHDLSRGREVAVVLYGDADGGRIGYAIVAAPAVEVPGAARQVTYRGMRFAVLRAGGAAVITWRHAGHTCVLASRTASPERLLRVAAWNVPEAAVGQHGDPG
jgi:hypothetical protein